MYISDAIIKNFSCFSQIELNNLNTNINVITGREGIGKSRLLTALSIPLAGIIKRRVYSNLTFNTNFIKSGESESNIQLTLKGSLFDSIYTVESIRNYTKSHTKYNSNDDTSLWDKFAYNKHHDINIEFIDMSDFTSEFYTDKTPNRHMMSFMNLCCRINRIENESSNQLLKDAIHQKLNFALNNFLPNIDSVEIIYPNKDLFMDVEIKFKKRLRGNVVEVLQFSQLSRSERCLVLFIMNFISKYDVSTLYYHPIINSNNIIFINNIENNIHPSYMYNLYDNLQLIFPETQFFITTTDPFLISNCLNDELIYLDYDLSGNRCRTDCELHGSDVNTISSYLCNYN